MRFISSSLERLRWNNQKCLLSCWALTWIKGVQATVMQSAKTSRMIIAKVVSVI
jgi:hypothetical protein